MIPVKKKYIRFVTFFILIFLFRSYENYLLSKTAGINLEIDFINFVVFILVATIFTLVAEITEKIIEVEEEKLENFVKDKLEESIEILEESI